MAASLTKAKKKYNRTVMAKATGARVKMNDNT